MIQAAKIIGTGLATTGLIGAGVGIGVEKPLLIIIYILFSRNAYLFNDQVALKGKPFLLKKLEALIEEASQYKLLNFICIIYSNYFKRNDDKYLTLSLTFFSFFKKHIKIYSVWYVSLLIFSIVVPFIYVIAFNLEGLTYLGLKLNVLYSVFIYCISTACLAHFLFSKEDKQSYSYFFRYSVVILIYFIFIPYILLNSFISSLGSKLVYNEINKSILSIKKVIWETADKHIKLVLIVVIFFCIARSILYALKHLAIFLDIYTEQTQAGAASLFIIFFIGFILYTMITDELRYVAIFRICRNVSIIYITLNIFNNLANEYGLLNDWINLFVAGIGEISFTSLLSKINPDGFMFHLDSYTEDLCGQKVRPFDVNEVNDLVDLIKDKLVYINPSNLNEGLICNKSSIYNVHMILNNLNFNSKSHLTPEIISRIESMNLSKLGSLYTHKLNYELYDSLSKSIKASNFSIVNYGVPIEVSLPPQYISFLDDMVVVSRSVGDTNQDYFNRMILASTTHIINIQTLLEGMEWLNDVYSLKQDSIPPVIKLNFLAKMRSGEMVNWWLKDGYNIEHFSDKANYIRNCLSYFHLETKAIEHSGQSDSEFVKRAISESITMMPCKDYNTMYIKIYLDLFKNILPTLFYSEVAGYVKMNNIDLETKDPVAFNEMTGYIYGECQKKYMDFNERYFQLSDYYLSIESKKWLWLYDRPFLERPSYRPWSKGLELSYNFGHRPINLASIIGMAQKWSHGDISFSIHHQISKSTYHAVLEEVVEKNPFRV